MYQLFDNEFWKSWARFDVISKRFIAQLKRDYEEELKNGKSIKELHEVQIDSDSNDAM